MSATPSPSIKENLLKSIKISFEEKFKIGDYAIDNSNLEIMNQHSIFGNYLIYYFSTEILGQPNIQKYKVSFEVPKNLWAYICKTFDLPYKTIKIDKYITFNHTALMPQINYKKDENKIVMWSQIDSKEKGISVTKEKEEND